MSVGKRWVDAAIAVKLGEDPVFREDVYAAADWIKIETKRTELAELGVLCLSEGLLHPADKELLRELCASGMSHSDAAAEFYAQTGWRVGAWTVQRISR